MTAMQSVDDVKSALQGILDRQRQAFNSEGPVEAGTRIDRIERCIALLVDEQNAICDAIHSDFGTRARPVSLMMEIFTSVSTLKDAAKNVRKWMKPERRKAPVPINILGGKAFIQYQPKGVVGIMTPWNVPINMIFSPLAGVLAAGNRAMIKPSEFTPACGELMKSLFARYFEDSEIAVVTGGPDVGGAFASLPLDHLIFTGATSIGRMVMRAAAENLTPVTLELGGKSPVIISHTADFKDAVDKLITGKSMNAGQLCISPDYAFVPSSRIEEFISEAKQVFNAQFPRIMDNPDYVAMINVRHHQRVRGYLKDAEEQGCRLVNLSNANEDFSCEQHHKIPVHLAIDPKDSMKVMQDEIFGPILNIKPYDSLDQAIQYINGRDRPLALYYFGKDSAEQDEVLARTISGGVTINDVAMHFACDDIPFGGIGPSGMGNYHGVEGFRTFSHARGVLKQGVLNLSKLAGTRPPYGSKIEQMMAAQIKK